MAARPSDTLSTHDPPRGGTIRKLRASRAPRVAHAVSNGLAANPNIAAIAREHKTELSYHHGDVVIIMSPGSASCFPHIEAPVGDEPDFIIAVLDPANPFRNPARSGAWSKTLRFWNERTRAQRYNPQAPQAILRAVQTQRKSHLTPHIGPPLISIRGDEFAPFNAARECRVTTA